MQRRDLTTIEVRNADTYFQGKNVIVTGGSSGIGKATAKHLAREGANVFIVARDEGKLKRALQGSPGPLRSVLDLVLAHQRCDWAAVDVGSARLGISNHILPSIFAEALQYSDHSSGMSAARAA